MTGKRSVWLDRPVVVGRDHVLGAPDAAMTLVEYGAYAGPERHAAHDAVSALRKQFGGRLRYVFRHLPPSGNAVARRAATMAEYAAQSAQDYWQVHEAMMDTAGDLTHAVLDDVATRFGLDHADIPLSPRWQAAERRVDDDVASAKKSGALVTPTFFINGRRYEGPWDETSLADAMVGSLGYRMRTAASDFIRWGPSAGLLLLLMSVAAVVLTNAAIGPSFQALWQIRLGLHLAGGEFSLSVLDWINHGLLTIFFFVVGLEIKRELTVGELATVRAAALPLIAAAGGIVIPALIYLATVPPGPLAMGWGVPIATDTAFAVALIVLLGDRVPAALRVFFTAAVIIDDLVAIGIIALFYTGELSTGYLVAAGIVTVLLIALNRSGVYGPLPYAVLGIALWVFLQDAGLHATLAGVILALVVPTLPPANARSLVSQAQIVIEADQRRAAARGELRAPSEHALRTLDAIHARIESPADKLLRTVEPWSSYVVLPLFALANAGVVWSPDVFAGNGALMLGLVLGLVFGKPLGIASAAWVAVRLGIAEKSDAYTWRQLCGAGALGGLGFTMSLFIAKEAFPDPAHYAAAKIAIFIASLTASAIAVAILYPAVRRGQASEGLKARRASRLSRLRDQLT